jgi:hypothetical protein
MVGIVTSIIAALSTSIVVKIAMAVISFVLSAVFQQKQAEQQREKQRKMQEEAEARADAAKGIKIVADSEAISLSVIYGRQLVGGNRVHHVTLNNYYANAPDESATIFKASTSLDSNISGSKHEFLLTQQSLCFGGINAVYAVDIDSKKINGEYVNEFNEVQYNIDPNAVPSGVTKVDPYTHGAKVAVYKDGSMADPWMTANDSTRETAEFTNVAYATCAYRINRDDPQFGGPPTAQFYVEGMKVKTIEGTAGSRTLSAGKTYSNNPALCLIDYLTNSLYGRGLSVDKLDLDSFYEAYILCEQVVDTSSLEGSIWRAKGGTRQLHKYECNIALDSRKTIRENVEILLESMPNCEFVWSGGKYKLRVQYPYVYETGVTYPVGAVVQQGLTLSRAVNSTSVSPDTPAQTDWVDAIDVYLTDDDIIRGDENSIVWPNAQSRFNYCTVRYLNTAKDYTEDTVSWPERDSAAYIQYLVEDSNQALETEVFASHVDSYKLALAHAEQIVRLSRVSTTYTLPLNKNYFKLEPGDITKVTSDVLNIPGEIIKVTEVNPNDRSIQISGVKFDAAALAWNAKDDEVVATRHLFREALAQVSNLAYVPNSTYTSTSPGLITWTAESDGRVNSFEILATTTPVDDITIYTEWQTVGTSGGTSFQLPTDLVGEQTITVVPRSADARASQTEWPLISTDLTNRLFDTNVYVTIFVYKRSATLPATPTGGSFDVAARSFSSVPSGWSATIPAGVDALYRSECVAVAVSGIGVDSDLVWETPTPITEAVVRASAMPGALPVLQATDGTNYGYANAFGRIQLLDGSVDYSTNVAVAYSILSNTNCTASVDNTATAARGSFSVSSLTGNLGHFIVRCLYDSINYDVRVDVGAINVGATRDITPPPDPTDITLSTALTTVFLDVNDTLTYLQGHGHDATVIYGAEVSIPTPNPVFADAVELSSFKGNSGTYGSSLDRDLRLWFKFKTRDGVVSINPYPSGAGLDASTGKIGNVDLGPLIIEAANLAENSVNATHLSANSIAVGTLAVQNGAITNAMIGSLTADKITTGTLQTGNEIAVGDNLKLSAEGWIESYAGANFTRLADYARITSGSVELHRYIDGVGDIVYTALSRLETGSANSGDTVVIPGYWKTQPKVLVSPASLGLYKTAYSAQDQSVICSATSLVETAPNSKRWQFLAKADLVLSAYNASVAVNNSSGAISTNNWTSNTVTTPTNCSSITVNVRALSVKGNGLSQHYYRRYKWRVEYYSGGAWVTSDAFRTVNIGEQTSSMIVDSKLFTFPSSAAWQWRIYFEAEDTDGSIFGSVAYTYTDSSTTFSDTAFEALHPVTRPGPVNSDTFGSLPTPSGSGEIYQINLSYTFNATIHRDAVGAGQQPIYSTVTWYYNGSTEDGYANIQFPYTTGNDYTVTGSVTYNRTISGSNLTVEADVNPKLKTNIYAQWTTYEDFTISGERTGTITAYRRTVQANSTTPSNTYEVTSYTYDLTSATILASGTLNWIAVGD